MSKRSPKRIVEASLGGGEPMKFDKPVSVYDAMIAIAERDRAKQR